MLRTALHGLACAHAGSSVLLEAASNFVSLTVKCVFSAAAAGAAAAAAPPPPPPPLPPPPPPPPPPAGIIIALVIPNRALSASVSSAASSRLSDAICSTRSAILGDGALLLLEAQWRTLHASSNRRVASANNAGLR